MNIYSRILIAALIMVTSTLRGQNIDSVQYDLKNLSPVDFYKKYSFSDGNISEEDLNVTKLMWSTEHLRKADKSLRAKGIRTFTIIDERPSLKNKYYIIGHYQLPTPDHLSRISSYRIDLQNKAIEYQSLNDLAENKWKRIE